MNCSICRKRKASFNSKHWPLDDLAVCDPCYEEFHIMMDKIKYKSGSTISCSDYWNADIATRWIKEMKAVIKELKTEVEQVKEEAERATEEEIKQMKEEAERATKEKIKQVKEEMKKREEEWINYLLADAFTEESHSDIQVKPSNGPSIPAHKFLLATKSEVFKYMLSSDTCKAAEIDSICLPEFNHEELKTFLELLYCGNLPKEKFEMHYYSLALASHKYAIPYLQKFCEERILNLVDLSNAFKVLEISEFCSNETLKVAALELIRNHKEKILWSPAFEEYSIRNPHLMVQVTRYCCTQAK